MTEQSDKSSYLGNENLKSSGVNQEFTQEQVEEYIKCSQDPIYFIKNYIQIVNVDEGLVPFNLYDYQANMIDKIHENRFVIAKMPRQSGKSTRVVAYLLHFILFNPTVNVAILANKLATARELLGRLKLAYEYLPKWLQQGIVEWNKGNIVLENGSKVLASATSSSAVRGGSFNMIFLDEFAYVPQNVADEFFSSVYPTISSGKETKVLIISTPKGLNQYYKMWVDAEENRNSYIPIEVHWSEVPGRDERWKKETIRNTSEEQFKVEFECDFIGSANTLISSSKLKSLAFRTPLHKYENGLQIYEEPEKGHNYAMTVDVSRGVGQDYSALVVFDITEVPYKVVAVYRNNEISPMVFPNLIAEIGARFGKCPVLVEINDIGGQVADLLWTELEYDTLVQASVRGRKGQTLDGGFGAGGQSQLGIRTTSAVKKLGCSILKTMIEDDKLLFQDYDIINELTAFVSKRMTYEAEVGHHDDLVMCMVIFAWWTSQNYFRDMTDVDVRKALFEEKQQQIDEELTPFGFIDDGTDDDRWNDDGVWLS